MKKIIYGVLVLAIFSFSNSANAQMETKGANFINLGLGFPVIPTGIGFNASYEYGIFNTISIGGLLEFNTGNDTYGYINGNGIYNYSNRRVNTIALAFRGSYHFNKLLRIKQKNVDIYAGGATGVYVRHYSYDGNSGINQNGSADYLYGVLAGAKYFISDHFGFFGELSSYNSILKVGIALKF